MLAAVHGHNDILQLLLSAGADVSAIDEVSVKSDVLVPLTQSPC